MNAIALASTVEEINAVRSLFKEYAAELAVDLCFQGFSRELETLPGAYAAPAGTLLRAQVDGEIVGCVAMKPLDHALCEMKRLFVRPLFRGRGLAGELVTEILGAAQAAGYRAMVLDTLAWMRPAIQLYESFGFKRRPAYYDNPLPGAIYFQRPIGKCPVGVRCREFAFGSEDYREAIEVRERVLRRPLGLAWEAGAFQGEEASFHLGAFLNQSLVATLLLMPLTSDTVKMRQVAVRPELQGRGVGRALVQFAEQFALSRGYLKMVAHARETALPFYHSQRYEVVGERFMEVGIPHFAISKSLAGKVHGSSFP